MRVPFAYSEDFSGFRFGEGHPFTGDRFEVFHKRLKDLGLLKDRLEEVEAKAVDDHVLALVHTPNYIKKVYDTEKVSGFLSVDTQVLPGMVHAAKTIVGGVMAVTERLAKGHVSRAVALGGFHHAGADYGEGFCVFNDVALAAEWLIKEGGMGKVMIVDTDAHAGNGTSDIFYSRSDVLFISIHQDPKTIYPGKCFAPDIGIGKGKGFNVNVPVPPYSSDIQYEKVFDDIVAPLAKEFKPDVIIRNGGSDPFFRDELTNLALTADGLMMLGKRIREISDGVGARHLDLIISGYGDFVLEGWLAILKGAVGLEHIAHQFGPSPPRMDGMERLQIHNRLMGVVEEVKRHHRDYWESFK